MIRMQVQLTEEQYKLLNEFALHNGESISAVIRRAVDQLLLTHKPDRASLYRQARTVVGKYRIEGPFDISLEHDRY